MNKYRRLDFSKLQFAETPVSYEDAVKNAAPFEIPEEMLNNKQELQITNAEKNYEKHCVRLEIVS
ncbi:hypothetical protein [Roseburia inulinivorans]